HHPPPSPLFPYTTLFRSQLESSKSDNQALQTQIASLEQEIEEVRRLLSVKDNQLLALQQQSQAAGLDAGLPETETTTTEDMAPAGETAGAEAAEEPLAATTDTPTETLPDQTAEQPPGETAAEPAENAPAADEQS